MLEQSQENLNKFEIEERIEAALPTALKAAYHKLRIIKAEDIIVRIKSTEKREAHWNSIIKPLVGKYILELSKQHLEHNNQEFSKQHLEHHNQGASNMADQYTNELSIANTIALAVKEGIAQAIGAINASNTNQQQNNNMEIDLINKPMKYNGSRDPFVIDNFIKGINDYKAYKEWDDEQTFKFARTLMCDIGSIWLRNLELNGNDAPTTWTSLRAKIISGFKPTNSALVFRERLEELRQTTTISQYIQDFLTLKLGVPTMTDDEAVSKFIRHLKNKDARVHIRVLYRGDKCPTMNEAIQAAYVFESARNEHGTYSFLPNTNSMSVPQPIDDPMDLSALRDMVNYISSNSRGIQRGNYRGGYRGNFRGDFRGGFRGRGFSRGESRGGF